MNRIVPIFVSILIILSFQFIGLASAAGLAANPITLTNTTIDVGQVSVANTLVSGGSDQYYGQWTYLSSNGVNYQTVNTITVGSGPFGVAFNPSGTLAYVTSYDDGTISVINTATNTVVNTITGESGPYGVAFSPSGTFAYVANLGGTVSVVNIATNTVVNTITVGSTPYGVAFSPSGTLAYVSDSGANAVNVINTATNTIVNTIIVGSTPGAVAFNPSGTLAYVVVSGTNSVSVVNTATNTVVNTIAVGSDPEGIAITPSGALAYVTNYGSDSVSVVNIATNTVVNTVTVGTNPFGVVFNPSGTLAYVVNWNSNNVYVINTATNTVVSSISVSTTYALAINPSGTLLYVPNYGSTVSVFSTLPETQVQSVPSGVLQLVVEPTSSNTLTVTFNGIQYTESTGSSTVYGTWSLFGFAEDSNGYYEDTDFGGTPISIGNTLTESNTFTIDPAPTLTIGASSTDINLGQSVTFNGEITGGTGPLFTANLVVNNNVVSTLNGLSAGSVFTFNAITPSSSGSFAYSIVGTDTGTTTPFVFNSPSDTVTVTSSSSNGGGGTPANSVFTISDNINSHNSSAAPVATVTAGSASSSYYQNQMPGQFSTRSAGINVSYACSVIIGSQSYSFENTIYGISSGTKCNTWYTIYTQWVEAVYALNTSSSASTTALPATVAPATTTSSTTVPANNTTTAPTATSISPTVPATSTTTAQNATTTTQGTTGSSSQGIFQQIWNAIVNFFSHL